MFRHGTVNVALGMKYQTTITYRRTKEESGKVRNREIGTLQSHVIGEAKREKARKKTDIADATRVYHATIKTDQSTNSPAVVEKSNRTGSTPGYEMKREISASITEVVHPVSVVDLKHRPPTKTGGKRARADDHTRR